MKSSISEEQKWGKNTGCLSTTCNLERTSRVHCMVKYQIVMQLCYNVPKTEETSCHPKEMENTTKTEA